MININAETWTESKEPRILFQHIRHYTVYCTHTLIQFYILFCTLNAETYLERELQKRQYIKQAY
jgi:hypothetical protein